MIAFDKKFRYRRDVSPPEFLIGFTCLLVAVFFICVGLSLKTEVHSMPSQQQVLTSEFMACFYDDFDYHYLSNDTKVVLMVVDAWRLSHLVDPHSPMVFLREAILSGQAVAFVANVQTPTVTMPRIKALTSGVVPTLISLVTNFFATENVEDNWVNSAAAAGRRVIFFGDDTWLRLFPKAFDVAEGVTSFFVNDYTEVDNNITRHLNVVLTTDDWDLLILHYLGLDHVGHSLGGESVEIGRKLHEMDNIARRIFRTVSARSPLLFVLVGDHGMTNAGSHGGGSEAESRVPLLFFYSKAKTIQGGNLNELPYAEQVDLASTLPFFLRTSIPSCSIGLSLVPYLGEHWKFPEPVIFSALVQSTIHFSKFADDYALSHLMNTEEGERCQAAKVFLTNARSPSTLERNREVQRKIIQSEEQILRWPVIVGLVLAIFTFLIFSGLYPFYNLAKSVKTGALHYSTFLIFGLYHISSYSTSFIEEEHDTWYYITSTTVLLRILARVKCPLGSRNFLEMFDTESEVRREFCLLCLHRLAMTFTMSSRRRWCLRSDLLPPPIIPELRIEMPVLDTIFTDISVLAQDKHWPIITTALCTIYLGWRFQFMSTKFGRLAVIPCFLSMTICCSRLVNDQNGWMIYVVVGGSMLTATLSFPLGVLLYLFYLVRPETLPLLLICFEMGTLASGASYSPALFAFICQTVFFYPGQSSNISSIDIAVGYKGLSSYTAAFVLFQILGNFYATSTALTFGYLYHDDDKHSKEGLMYGHLSATLNLRSVVLCSAITGMISLSGHLFMFSVMAPKLLCEVLHTIIALIVTGSILFLCILFEKITIHKTLRTFSKLGISLNCR